MDHSERGPDQPSEEGCELSNREVEILRTMNGEGESVIAFQGLKRKLGMHQETLSRYLSRLQRDGLIENSSHGYRLNRKASIHLPDEGTDLTLPVINSYLPPSTDLQNLIAGLRGSWFGRLRWLRYLNKGSENTMTWITEDGRVQIDLKITNSLLTIQARVKESVEVKEAVIAAHELYGHISALYTKQLRQNRVSLLHGNSSKINAS